MNGGDRLAMSILVLALFIAALGCHRSLYLLSLPLARNEFTISARLPQIGYCIWRYRYKEAVWSRCYWRRALVTPAPTGGP